MNKLFYNINSIVLTSFGVKTRYLRRYLIIAPTILNQASLFHLILYDISSSNRQRYVVVSLKFKQYVPLLENIKHFEKSGNSLLLHHTISIYYLAFNNS